MKVFKKAARMFFIVAMAVSLMWSGVIAASTWNAQIRPGVMAGGGNNQTDFMLDLFIPVAGNEKSVFFLNPHVRIDDKSGNEQNMGLGFRTLLSGDKLILGANAYYDTMRSEYHNRYGQFGLGMEVLSKWVDFRANYYNPTGSRKNKIPGFDKYEFANTSLILNKGYEAALRGFDAEVGIMVPGLSDVIETRAFIGGFWYDSPISQDVNGWKGRIEIKPSRLINIDVEMRHDPVRGSDTFYGAYLDIPFSIDELTRGGNPFKGFAEAAAFGKGARSMKERMTQKVVRDRYVTTVAGSSTQDTKTIVKDMIFVNKDNSSDPDQDGSLRHPWESLTRAQQEDPRWKDSDGKQAGGGAWVYVFSSDNIADTYYDNHTQLGDNMVLWGQGYYHPVYNLGGYKGQTNPDWNPILDGGMNGELLPGAIAAISENGWLSRTCSNGSVVCLAHNNEIMGLTMQHGSHGIYGSNILNTNIHDNIIRNNAIENSGIHIENYWTPAEIDGKNLVYRFENNQILDNAGSGIYLYTRIEGSGKLENVSIDNIFANNTIQGNSGYGIYSNIYKSSSPSDPNSFIDGASFSNTFTGNTIGGSGEGQGNGYDGIRSNIEIYTNGDLNPISNTTISSRFEGNTVVNNGWDGIHDDYLEIDTFGPNSGLSKVKITRYVTDNEIRGNSQDGFYNSETTLRTSGTNSSIMDSSIESYIDRNIISNNGGNAVYLWGSRILTNGTGSPIARSTITSEFSMNQLSVSNPGHDAIRIYTTYITSASANSGLTDVSIANIFTGNTLDGSGSANDGISLGEGNNGPSVNIQVADASSAISRATIANTFTGNTVTNFLGDGIHFPGLYIQAPYVSGASVTGSSITNLVTNNTVTDNGGYGIYNWRNQIRAYTGGVTDSGLVDTYIGNTVSRNGLTGIYLDSDFTGGTNTSMNYTFTNNTIIGNGLAEAYDSSGLYLYIDPSYGNLMDKRLLLQGNTITNNFKYGVELYVNGTDTNDFKGDFGGGALLSTGGNTFSGNGSYDINHRGNGNMDVWALNNSWTNNANPESTIYDKQDNAGEGDVITSQP